MPYRHFILAVLSLWLTAALEARAVLAQPAKLGDVMRVQDHKVPLAPAVAAGGLMVVTIYRPDGEARHPVIVLSHGSPGPRSGIRAQYPGPTRWFVEQGFVVVMLNRRGHGLTGGPRPDAINPCAPNADFYGSGLETTKDFEAAIDYVRTLSYVASDAIIVAGQSTGGWASIATASRGLAGVRAAINFAGGRNNNANCPIDRPRIEAMSRYGRTAHIPTLWIYTENDQSFGPQLSRTMADAFIAAGGQADYHLLRPFGTDGHKMFGTDSAVGIWTPYVRDFLAKNALLPNG